MSALLMVAACVGKAGKDFVRDDSGSATIWSLLWLLVFAGMAGLAIDSTNAWRVKTMLVSTADVAALAGAWDLPYDYLDQTYAEIDQDPVRDSAVYFARRNLMTRYHGNYIRRDDDIDIGHWDFDTRTFTDGAGLVALGEDAPTINAVRVYVGESDIRGNSLPTTLLRLAGIYEWDVNALAIAALGADECKSRYGVIARGELKLSSQYKIQTVSCLHGQKSVDLGPHGEWADPSAITTGEDPAGDWKVNNNDQTIIGTGETVTFPPDGEGHRTDLYPPMVDYIPTIGAGMMGAWLHFRHFAYPAPEEKPTLVYKLPNNFATVNGTNNEGDGITTGWWNDGTIRLASLDGFSSIAGLLAVSATGNTTEPEPLPLDEDGNPKAVPTEDYGDDWQNKNFYNWPIDDTVLPEGAGEVNWNTEITSTSVTLEQNRIYFADKCQSNKLLLKGVIRNITLITNCKVDISGSARLENMVLLTTAGNVSSGDTSGITISNGAIIGAPTQCKDWGGVRMYSAGDIYANGTGSTPDTSDQSQFWGAQLVARNRIHFAAKSDGEKGISLLAGGDIDIAAQAELGVLTVQTPYPVAGCPDYGVKPEADASVYQPSLVE